MSNTHPGCDATCPNYCEHPDRDAELAQLRRELEEWKATARIHLETIGVLSGRLDGLKLERDKSDGTAKFWKDVAHSKQDALLDSQVQVTRLRGTLSRISAEAGLAADPLRDPGAIARLALAETPAPPLAETLGKVRGLIQYALGPTRDVKTPTLREALALLDSLQISASSSETRSPIDVASATDPKPQ